MARTTTCPCCGELVAFGGTPVWCHNSGWLDQKKESVSERLEYLRAQINAENISYSEIVDLQSLAEHIDPSDTQLLEWAGVPEHHTNTHTQEKGLRP